MKVLMAAIAALFFASLASPAEAMSKMQNGCNSNNDGRTVCMGAAVTVREPVYSRRREIVDANGNGAVIGGRPAGCPHRFCGCEASRYVFGKIRPELNLASNWIRKFPRTAPAPGMAAARSGHVMILMSHVSGSNWLVHDGNSGRHLTREHVRSIAGYVIVNPHAGRMASLN